MNWLRLYTSALDHPKIQKLPPELFKAWINLLMLARLNDGRLPNVGAIAFRLRCSEESAAAWVSALIDRGLIEDTPQGARPHDWEEYQYDSDSSTARSRKSRAKKKVQRPDATNCNVAATALQRPRIEENRKEVTPSGVTENPRAAEMPPSQIEEARQLLAAYPEARRLSGAPDSVLAAHCLDLAGGSLEELGRGLRSLMLTGKKPSLSWAWFRTVLPNYLRKSA